MNLLIILFGLLTLLAGLVIIYRPGIVFGPIRKHMEETGIYLLAIVLRAVLGALLISQAGLSRFPLLIEVLGWLSLLAATIFLLIGQARFVRLMSWALSLTETMGRLSGGIASAFGMFLVYAFV